MLDCARLCWEGGDVIYTPLGLCCESAVHHRTHTMSVRDFMGLIVDVLSYFLSFDLCVCVCCMLFFPQGSSLRTCFLQCLHHSVVLPAADMPSGQERGDPCTPASRATHHAQHALQTADHLRQCRLWLHRRSAAGPTAVTSPRLRA